MSACDVAAAEAASADQGDVHTFEALLDGWNQKHGCGEVGSGEDGDGRGLPLFDAPRERTRSPDVALWVSQLTIESQDLTRRIRSLEAELRQLRRARLDVQERERAFAITAVKEMMSLLRISVPARVDRFEKPLTPSIPEALPTPTPPTMTPRYRGPRGEVWMGRGRHPKWLKDLLDAGGCIGDYACTDPATEDASGARTSS